MDPNSIDDIATLLQRASSGDQAAWKVVVDHFGPRVFGLMRVNCGDPDLAEELTQSTFCTVASKISDGYQEHGRFESWLFRIAMNRLRDEMRRRKRHARPTTHEAMAAFIKSPSEADDEAFDEGDREALVLALEQLSSKERQIIDLRHVGGMSFRQIEELLQEPVGTLLARHHRALRKLRGLIENSQNDDSEA
jgi:RNA polymerase sigma-70 factor (ECF subfamily)